MLESSSKMQIRISLKEVIYSPSTLVQRDLAVSEATSLRMLAVCDSYGMVACTELCWGWKLFYRTA